MVNSSKNISENWRETHNGWNANQRQGVTNLLNRVLSALGFGQPRAVRELLVQMSSLDNTTALKAVTILRENAWLTNGTLKRAHLKEANLQHADLALAKLPNAFLLSANLEGANLSKADLQFATFIMANLKNAMMSLADLQGASLSYADLEGAVLTGANLHKTDFLETNLQHANLQNSSLNEATILPDGTHWTSEADLSRFTNPSHPQFWRSSDPSSPAFAGQTATELIR